MDKKAIIIKKFETFSEEERTGNADKRTLAREEADRKAFFNSLGLEPGDIKIKHPRFIVGDNECLERIEMCRDILQSVMDSTSQSCEKNIIEIREIPSTTIVYVNCVCDSFGIRDSVNWSKLKEMIDMSDSFTIGESIDGRLDVRFTFNDAYKPVY